jgi:hypothetical protein
MPDPVWEVQIQGHASDLEHLARHFTAPPIVVVKHQQDGYLLTSDTFATRAKAEDVRADGEQQLEILNGVLRFARSSHTRLTAGTVFRRYNDGTRDVFVHLRDGLLVRAELGELTVTTTGSDGVTQVPVVPPPPRSVAITRLALGDQSVAKALRLFGNGATDWVDLYRLHEVMEADVGGERKLIHRGWGSARQLKRFKHSANSVTVAGNAARHGAEPGDPPKNPMSIDEAQAYVSYVLHAWFASKGV